MKECAADNCNITGRLKGFCERHYRQIKRKGHVYLSKKEIDNSLPTNFYNNCEIITESGCWIWMEYVDRQGYGTITIKGYPCRTNRWSYTLACGEIPEGMIVCHYCDVPSCINPAHLFLGTSYDNVQDKIRKNRDCKGSKNGLSKLNEDQVIRIKERLRSGEKAPSIAKEYKVNAPCIYKIKWGDTWRHVG